MKELTGLERWCVERGMSRTEFGVALSAEFFKRNTGHPGDVLNQHAKLIVEAYNARVRALNEPGALPPHPGPSLQRLLRHLDEFTW